MPLLYILSLGYAIRLTIFFAMMGSVHVLPKFSFFPLRPLSLPIVVFLAFIVERGKNDQEASLVFMWRTSKTDIVSNVSSLKWIWWTDLWLKEGELRRISQFLLDMPEHNTSPHSHFFPHLFSFLNVFFPLHFTYVEEKKKTNKKPPEWKVLIFCQCVICQKFTQVSILKKRDYPLVCLLRSGFSSGDLRQGL